MKGHRCRGREMNDRIVDVGRLYDIIFCNLVHNHAEMNYASRSYGVNKRHYMYRSKKSFAFSIANCTRQWRSRHATLLVRYLWTHWITRRGIFETKRTDPTTNWFSRQPHGRREQHSRSRVMINQPGLVSRQQAYAAWSWDGSCVEKKLAAESLCLSTALLFSRSRERCGRSARMATQH